MKHSPALPRLLIGAALVAAPAAAQRSDLVVEQLSPGTSRTISQVAQEPRVSPQVTQLERADGAPSAPAQLASPPAGRDPALRQLAPRSAARAPTSQVAQRTTSANVPALPPHLVDACDRAAAGRGQPPKGVDCNAIVQASPPPPQLSAEEALLTNATERESQRVARERVARGMAPDAGEVARRLSTGDVANAPVAQAVAAQAASESLTPNSAPPSGQRPVIVPGGGTVVVPPGGN